MRFTLDPGVERLFDMWHWLLWPVVVVAGFIGVVIALGLLAALPWSIVAVCVIGGLVLVWGAMLVDVFRRSDLSILGKAIWTAAIIVFPVFGAIAYLIARPTPEQLQYRGEVNVE